MFGSISCKIASYLAIYSDVKKCSMHYIIHYIHLAVITPLSVYMYEDKLFVWKMFWREELQMLLNQ